MRPQLISELCEPDMMDTDVTVCLATLVASMANRREQPVLIPVHFSGVIALMALGRRTIVRDVDQPS